MPHLRLSRVLLSTFSPSYPAPPPSPFYLLFRRYQSVPSALELYLTLLFPPHSHENFFLFYAALCRCSCLLTHSLLRVFPSPAPSFTRGVCHAAVSSLFFLPFARAANDRALPSILWISLYPTYPTSPSLPAHGHPVYLSSIPFRAPSRAPPAISTTYLTSRASFRRLYLKH